MHYIHYIFSYSLSQCVTKRKIFLSVGLQLMYYIRRNKSKRPAIVVLRHLAKRSLACQVNSRNEFPSLISQSYHLFGAIKTEIRYRPLVGGSFGETENMMEKNDNGLRNLTHFSNYLDPTITMVYGLIATLCTL